MPTVSRTIARFFDPDGAEVATLGITYNDINKSVAGISWTVKSGTLTLTLHQPGKADLVIAKTADGSQNLPAGYTLDTLNQAQFDVNWTS